MGLFGLDDNGNPIMAYSFLLVGLVWVTGSGNPMSLVWFGLVDNGSPIRAIQFLLVGGTSDVVGMVNITG